MDHKELDVWRKSIDLVELIYSLTSSFPKSERFGLTSQMRRAAISISSNIAEGSARKGNKELLQFLNIALGSLAELETQYIISIRLAFLVKNNEVDELFNDQKRLLLGYRNYINKKI
ncbi:MAG: four helix bundle protein [Aequorivita sp.]|nr:MAG: four helix bundle protein [Aequorivita sp.]